MGGFLLPKVREIKKLILRRGQEKEGAQARDRSPKTKKKTAGEWSKLATLTREAQHKPVNKN